MRITTILVLAACLSGCGEMSVVETTETESTVAADGNNIQIHRVQDLLPRMPVVQLVGPVGTTDAPPMDSVLHVVHNHFEMLERPAPTIVPHEGTLVVTASTADHEAVAAALSQARITLDDAGR